LSHEHNVLSTETLLLLLDLHERVRGMTLRNKTFVDICLKIPITNILLESKRTRKRRRRRQITENETMPGTTMESTKFEFNHLQIQKSFLSDIRQLYAKEQKLLKTSRCPSCAFGRL
jgi:hypothetical protein